MGICDEKRGALYVGRMALEMEVQGGRKRGSPKRRWLERYDIKERGLSVRKCRRN